MVGNVDVGFQVCAVRKMMVHAKLELGAVRGALKVGAPLGPIWSVRGRQK